MSKLNFEKGVSIVVSGTTNWAQLTEHSGPNKLSEKYQVELTLDQASQKELASMKILDHVNVKRQDGSTKYDSPTIRFKSKNVVKVYDTNRQIFNDLIGNGSKMRVQGVIKSYEMAGKKGLTCYINKALIIELNDVDQVDDTEFWAGLPDASELKENQSKIPQASTEKAFSQDDEDDDLPF